MVTINNRARSPVAAFMAFASLVLFAFAGYLTYRAVVQHSDSAKSILQTCEVSGRGQLVDYYHDMMLGDMLVLETQVDVSGGPGTGLCDIAVVCTQSHYSGGVTFCDAHADLPLIIDCWNTAADDTPVCVAPGAEWRSSMVGAIVTWVFAIAFVLIAFMLQKSVNSRMSVPVETVTVVRFPGEPMGAAPVLMGAPVVVTGTPYPMNQQQPYPINGGGYPISAGGQYPSMDPPMVVVAQPMVQAYAVAEPVMLQTAPMQDPVIRPN